MRSWRKSTARRLTRPTAKPQRYLAKYSLRGWKFFKVSMNGTAALFMLAQIPELDPQCQQIVRRPSRCGEIPLAPHEVPWYFFNVMQKDYRR
jgi:hypothetical protein